MRRGVSRRGQPSSSSGNAAAQVAKEQGLPLGWLAERRSGGHYVVYSPSGERFTSINAARQAARAQAENGGPLPLQAHNRGGGGGGELAQQRVQAPQAAAVAEVAPKPPPREKVCAADYAACAATLPDIGTEGIDVSGLYQRVYAPFDEAENRLRAVEALLGPPGKRSSVVVGNWRRGERLEAAYQCLFASDFDVERATSALRVAARKRRAGERSWNDAEAIEAARLVDSLSKDLGAVAARLRRPLGDVIAFYYREYKAYWSRRKARWPAKTGYEATKRKRRNALDYHDEIARPNTRVSAAAAAAAAPASASSTSAEQQQQQQQQSDNGLGLRVDTNPQQPSDESNAARCPSVSGRYLICASPRGSLAKRLAPRGWVPTPRSSAAHLVLDDLDDEDEEEGADDELVLEDDSDQKNGQTQHQQTIAIERIAKPRQYRDTDAFDAHQFLKATIKQRKQQQLQQQGIQDDAGDEDYGENGAMMIRPPTSDEAVKRLSGSTFQGLNGGIWYVAKHGDTINSVAAERSLCPRQLRFINAGLVSDSSAETFEGAVIEPTMPLDADLGLGVSLLLPDMIADFRVPYPPMTPKLAGGEVVRKSKTSPLWYISRPGESLSAVALFLAGACVTPGSLEKAPKGKKKLPSPRLGSRYQIDDRGRQHLIDALFREQLKWLPYVHAKTLLSTSLRERTPLLVPDSDPWPRHPDGNSSSPASSGTNSKDPTDKSDDTDNKPEEEEITVLGVAPPVLDSEDAEALMRGEIVVEKETKRRWAAFAGGEALTLRQAALSAAAGAFPSLTRGVVALPTARAVSLQLQSGGASSASATGLPRTMRSAAKALQVEEAELRRLNSALGFVSTFQQQQAQPSPKKQSAADARNPPEVDKADEEECKVSMLLLPEPLRSACASCRVSRISAWRCRSELKHTAQPCDKSPQGGWYANARVRVLANTKRIVVALDDDGVTEIESEEIGRIWLEARVDRVADNDDKASTSPTAKSSEGKLLIVESQTFDPRDGEIQGSQFIGKRRFAVHWPSAHVVACPAGTQFSQQQTRGAAFALDKMRKCLVGRTLDAWGDGPPLFAVSSVALPRWRVVAVYRTIDEHLRLSGDDDLVAVLEPAARSVDRSLRKLYGDGEAHDTDADQEELLASVNKRGYVRYSATRLVATGSGWRACAACVVDGSCDVRRCRHALRHEDPDSDAVPERGDAVRLRVPRGSSYEWLYGIAIAARRPSARQNEWMPSMPTGDGVDVVDDLYDDSLDSATPNPPLLQVAVRVSEVVSRNKILNAAGKQPSADKDVIVVLSWPKPRHAVCLPKSSKQPGGQRSSEAARRSPTAEQRAWIGRFWRKKTEDFTKLRTAISRNDSSKGEARLRLVIDCFESFAEGMDGVCVEHVPASRRGASIKICKKDAIVTRCDAWLETMVSADALGAALPWQPIQMDDVDDESANKKLSEAAKSFKPGDTCEIDESHHYFVCRRGETMAYIAEWTGADASQLRRANAKLLTIKSGAASSVPSGSADPEAANEDEDDSAVAGSKRRRANSSSSSLLQPSGGKALKRQRRNPRRNVGGTPANGSAVVANDVCVFAAGDVVRIPATPLVYARRVPPVDAVEGDAALASGEIVEADGGCWYSCTEDDTCEQVAQSLGCMCDANEIVAANRHRRALRALTSRSQLARWTVLFVPEKRTHGDDREPRRRRKPCANCVVSGERNTRKCRDQSGHLMPDYDDLSAASSDPHFVGARIRVRWLDEDSNTAQWLYATVESSDKNTLSVSYDETEGLDEIQWPSPDAVALPKDTPPRPKVSSKDEALVGKSFEWANGNDEKQRWVVTDVFDSLDEGVDALVATIKPLKKSTNDDEDEIYETLQELLAEAINWQDATTALGGQKRQRDSMDDNDDAKKIPASKRS